jgi:hypothetical protein
MLKNLIVILFLELVYINRKSLIKKIIEFLEHEKVQDILNHAYSFIEINYLKIFLLFFFFLFIFYLLYFFLICFSFILRHLLGSYWIFFLNLLENKEMLKNLLIILFLELVYIYKKSLIKKIIEFLEHDIVQDNLNHACNFIEINYLIFFFFFIYFSIFLFIYYLLYFFSVCFSFILRHLLGSYWIFFLNLLESKKVLKKLLIIFFLEVAYIHRKILTKKITKFSEYNIVQDILNNINSYIEINFLNLFLFFFLLYFFSICFSFIFKHPLGFYWVIFLNFLKNKNVVKNLVIMFFLQLDIFRETVN